MYPSQRAACLTCRSWRWQISVWQLFHPHATVVSTLAQLLWLAGLEAETVWFKSRAQGVCSTITLYKQNFLLSRQRDSGTSFLSYYWQLCNFIRFRAATASTRCCSSLCDDNCDFYWIWVNVGEMAQIAVEAGIKRNKIGFTSFLPPTRQSASPTYISARLMWQIIYDFLLLLPEVFSYINFSLSFLHVLRSLGC